MNVTGTTQKWRPAYNKMLYIVSGSNVSQPNYRYVCDVETTAGSRLARLKCDKVPTTNRGFFDVSRVVETLIVPTTPSLSEVGIVNHSGFTSGYRLQFYEEYGSTPVVITGSPTTVSGVGTFAGNLDQLEVASWVSDTYFPPASIDVPSMRALTSYADDTDGLVGQAKNPLILQSDSHSWVAFGQAVSGNTILQNIEVRYSTGRIYTIAVPSGSTNAIRLACGPAQLKLLTSGQCSDGLPGSNQFPAANGQVIILPESGGDYGLGITYKIAECAQFNTIPVHYMNKYGGIDTYLFTMKNRERADITRQTYGANSDVYATNTYDKMYSGEYTYTYTLQSDWLSNQDSQFLIEMIRSGQVWLQIDGEMIEGIVQTNTYRFVTRRNDQLQQLQVEVMVAYRNSIL